MKLTTRTAVIGGIAALALSTATSGVDAKIYKLTAASSHPPIVPWVAVIKNYVVPQSNARLKEIGSPDSIQWTQAYAGALYNFNNTLEGVQDGLTDIGWVGTLWEPVKMPLHNVTFYAPFTSATVHQLVDIQEEMETTIPAMKKEWDKHNQVYLGAQAVDTYHIVSTFPINSMADLKGKKFMAPGAVAGWLRGTGAIGINGGLPISFSRAFVFGPRVSACRPELSWESATFAMSRSVVRFPSAPPRLSQCYVRIILGTAWIRTCPEVPGT